MKTIYDEDMVYRNKLLVFCIFFAVLSVTPFANAGETVRFLSVIDGDSLRVEHKGRTKEVRLIGVDAPEWGQEYGTKAKTFSLRFCYGQTLRLEFDKRTKDRYGRVLAYVYKGDEMLNEEIVRAGLALAVRYKPNTRHQKRLEKAQDEARTMKQGFWLRGGLKETPREWRKNKKK